MANPFESLLAQVAPPDIGGNQQSTTSSLTPSAVSRQILNSTPLPNYTPQKTYFDTLLSATPLPVEPIRTYSNNTALNTTLASGLVSSRGLDYSQSPVNMDVIKKYMAEPTPSTYTDPSTMSINPAKVVQEYALQPFTRAVAGVALSAVDMAANMYRDQNYQTHFFSPTNDIERFFYGDDKVESTANRLYKAGKTGQQTITPFLNNNTTLPPYANKVIGGGSGMVAAALFTIGDLFPGVDDIVRGAGRKLLAEELVSKYGDDTARRIIAYGGKDLAEKVLKEAPETFDIVKYAEENFDPTAWALLKKSDAAAARLADNGQNFSLTKLLKESAYSAKVKAVDQYSPILDPISDAEKSGFVLDYNKNLQNYIDNVQNVPAMADQFDEDYGFKGLVQTFADLDSKYAKDPIKPSENFHLYMVYKNALELLQNTGKNPVTDSPQLMQDFVNEFASTFTKQEEILRNYASKLLDQAVEFGFIDREVADKLRKENPSYVPLNRIFDEIELADSRAFTGASAPLSVATNKVIQKRVGSAREVENIFLNFAEKSRILFREGWSNKIAGLISDMRELPGNPFGVEDIRVAANVVERQQLYKNLKTSRQFRDELQKRISNTSRDARALATEIRNLNLKGLHLSLKPERATDLPSLVPKVKITESPLKAGKVVVKDSASGRVKSFAANSDAGKVMKGLENKAQRLATKIKETTQAIRAYRSKLLTIESGTTEYNAILEALSNARKDSQKLKKTLDKAKRDLAGIGREVEGSLPISEGKKTASFMPGQERSVTAEQVSDSTLDRKDVKKFVEHLITLPDKEVTKIQAKIANREPKLAKLIDDIQALKEGQYQVAAKRASDYALAQSLKDAERNGRKTISYFKNGVKEVVAVNPEIERAVKQLGVEKTNLLVRTLLTAARAFKLGATGIYVPFLAANVVIDQTTRAIFGKAGWRALRPETLYEAFATALGVGDYYKQMQRYGGMQTLAAVTRGNAGENAAYAVERYAAGRSFGSQVKYVAKKPSEWLRVIEDAVSTGERFTRAQEFIGSYKKYIAMGKSSDEAGVLAAKNAREATVNFARRGEWANMLGVLNPYLNASIQGTRTLLRNLKDRPLETSAKMIGTVGIPLATITAWNVSDPERKKAYEQIQPYERDKYLVIVPPNPVYDEQSRTYTNVVTIPIPPGIRDLMRPFRRVIEHVSDVDPLKLQDISATLLGAFSPLGSSGSEILSNITPPIIKPTIETAANYDLYRGRAIVPENMKRAPTQEQVYPNTTGTAKLIGGALDKPPIIVEHWLKGTFGPIARQGLGISDQFLKAIGQMSDKDAKGIGIFDDVTNRFTGAYGGYMDTKNTQTISKILKKAENAGFVRNQAAEKLYEDMKNMSPSERIVQLNQLKRTDPDLYKKVYNTAKDAKLGLTYNDRLLTRLTIKNGYRAEAIMAVINSMKSAEDKQAYYEDLRKKKIITKEVNKQIKELMRAK